MPRPRPRRASERGAALLVAVVSVAVLTALAVDLAYETQVRLATAAHARDALRAEALAQSGVTMARLMVSLQRQVDKATAAICNAVAGAGTAGGAQPTAACPRPQVWNLVPVTSELTASLFGDAGAAPTRPAAAPTGDGAAATATTSYGDFDGGYDARIEDESEKINVQIDALLNDVSVVPQVEALLRLVCEPKWDPLFNRTDADGQRYSRADLLVHLRDWVDDDANSSGLNASFPGGNCSFEVRSPAFQKSFSDENFPYDRGADRYKAKNNRFDSVEELHLVAGLSDAFMAAFGDRFTVYLPRGAGRNVNTNDLDRQLEIARAMAEPASEIVLRDPEFKKRLQKMMLELRMGGFLSITPVQFAQALQQLDVTVRPQYLTQGPNNPFTDSTLVYRIRSSAVAGDVTHTTEAVVSFEERLLPNSEKAPTQGRAPNMNPPLGRLIRWHEE
jgi:general secretion pathway protein K